VKRGSVKVIYREKTKEIDDEVSLFRNKDLIDTDKEDSVF
jgi:hypothetical protein